MTITNTPRLGLPQWSAGSDAFDTRAVVNAANLAIETKAAMYGRGAIGTRPAAAAANAGMIWETPDGSMSWSTGTAWLSMEGAVVDVRDFLAPTTVGDLVTDHTTAFQAAVNAAVAAKLPLRIPPGVINVAGPITAAGPLGILGVGTDAEAGVFDGRTATIRLVHTSATLVMSQAADIRNAVLITSGATVGTVLDLRGIAGCNLDNVRVAGNWTSAGVKTSTPSGSDTYDAAQWRMSRLSILSASTNGPSLLVSGQGRHVIDGLTCIAGSEGVGSAVGGVTACTVRNARFWNIKPTADSVDIHWTIPAPLVVDGFTSTNGRRLLLVDTATDARVTLRNGSFDGTDSANAEHIRWNGPHGQLHLDHVAFPVSGSPVLIPKVAFLNNSAKNVTFTSTGVRAASHPLYRPNQAPGFINVNAGRVVESHRGFMRLDTGSGLPVEGIDTTLQPWLNDWNQKIRQNAAEIAHTEVEAIYSLAGPYEVKASMRLDITAAGTAGHPVEVVLPVAPSSTTVEFVPIGSFYWVRSGGNPPLEGTAILVNNGGTWVARFFISGQTGLVGVTPSAALAAGDVFTMNLCYRI